MTNSTCLRQKKKKSKKNPPREWHVLQLCKSLHCLSCEGRLDLPICFCTPSVTMCCFGWRSWRILASQRCTSSLITVSVLPGCCTQNTPWLQGGCSVELKHTGVRAVSLLWLALPWCCVHWMGLFPHMCRNECPVLWKIPAPWIMEISPTADTFRDVTKLLTASLLAWWCLGRWLAHSGRYRLYKALIFT